MNNPAESFHESTRFEKLRPNESKALSNKHVIIVDDDEDCRLLYSKLLEDRGAYVETARSVEEFKAKVLEKRFDLVLMDIYLDGSNGLDGVRYISKSSPLTKVVVVTAHNSVDLAVEALNFGAVDFIVKSEPADLTCRKIQKIMATDFSEDADIDPTVLGIIGHSKALRSVLAKVYKIKDANTTVLLTGESGTGKEMMAKAVHSVSLRKSETFIAVNCAAISESLLEAELFGFKKGAFTDAKKDRKGFFETTARGTLLLDEIGELSLNLQAKLLRVLQEREVTPVGSCYPVKVDTRVIAATNRDLWNEVKKGNFREDLYYRLSVINIEVPPLRDRREDIPELTGYFVGKFNQQFSKQVAIPPSHLMARLKAYDWPGNVRELHNAVERAVILAESSDMKLEDLLPYRELNKASAEDVAREVSDLLNMPINFQEAKHKFERDYLKRLVRISSGNITEASKLSGQYRANIYRLLKKHQMAHSDYVMAH